MESSKDKVDSSSVDQKVDPALQDIVQRLGPLMAIVEQITSKTNSNIKDDSFSEIEPLIRHFVKYLAESNVILDGETIERLTPDSIIQPSALILHLFLRLYFFEHRSFVLLVDKICLQRLERESSFPNLFGVLRLVFRASQANIFKLPVKNMHYLFIRLVASRLDPSTRLLIPELKEEMKAVIPDPEQSIALQEMQAEGDPAALYFRALYYFFEDGADYSDGIALLERAFDCGMAYAGLFLSRVFLQERFKIRDFGRSIAVLDRVRESGAFNEDYMNLTRYIYHGDIHNEELKKARTKLLEDTKQE